MYNINLTVGDWSEDGHNQSDSFPITSNLNAKQFEAAFKKGSKIIGFDLTKLCTDYEDDTFPEYCKNQITKNIDCSKLNGPGGYDYWNEEDGIEDGLYPDFYAALYLHIAKLGNPKLEAEFIKLEEINIGGYGLYH